MSDEVNRIHRLTLKEAYVYTNVFPVMAPLLRRKLVDRVGDFDPALLAAEDWDYWIRCERCGTFAYLPGLYAVYRIHGTQMHKDYAFMVKYCRMMAVKNYPNDPRSVRRLIGLVLWWQYGIQRLASGGGRFSVLRSPSLLRSALRMPWEVRNLKDILFIRSAFKRGL